MSTIDKVEKALNEGAHVDITPAGKVTIGRAASILLGRNVVVYDLEIKKPIEKCSKGWNSHDEMGVSVGCAYDYRTGRYRVFMDDNLAELVDRLNEPGTLIVAFNHIGFDNRLLRATQLPGLPQLKRDTELSNFDMLVASRLGAGQPAEFRKGGFKLDDHLKTLGLPMKTGDGASAPLWWQEGKVGRVVDYCMNDVTQERALFEDMWVTGTTACAFKPERYPIVLPELR